MMKKENLKYIEDSAIEKVGYDKDNKILYIEFYPSFNTEDNKVYEYKNINYEMYIELIKNERPIVFFNNYIRNKYRCVKVDKSNGEHTVKKENIKLNIF